jgi:hypothetical protein
MNYVNEFCEFRITYWIISQFGGTPCGEARHLLGQQDMCTHIRASVQGTYNLKYGGVYICRGDPPQEMDGRQRQYNWRRCSPLCVTAEGGPGMRTTPMTDVRVALGRTRSNHRCCYNNRYLTNRYHGQGISAHHWVPEILMIDLSSLASQILHKCVPFHLTL